MSPRRKTPSKKAAPQQGSFWLWLVKALILVGIWGGVLGGALVAYYAYDMPDIREVAQPQRRPAITIMSEDGAVIARYGDLYGQRATLDQVPKELVKAILSIEDRRFFDHFGVDVFGLMRAAVRNLMAGHVVQGGSTLTQQLAKNLFLSPERTLRRKIQEVLLALWLEHTYTKEQILTAYLNRVYLGAGTYGVDAASEAYFGKPVQSINLREAAIIAGLLRAPSRYAPTNDMAASLSRAKVVLSAMVDEGYITEAEKEAALSGGAVPPRKPGATGDGRYFADWVAEQVDALIEAAPQDLTVITTLDFGLQRAAERRVSAALSSGEARGVSQAALVTLAPDGAVKALVGGADYHDSQFNRAIQAQRQPGSSFKPVIYLTAIEKGLQSTDLLEDAPVSIGGWSPENYDQKYRGTITAREALAESINTIAVRLLQKVGVHAAIRTARALGVTSDIDPDLSLALGTNLVTPLELTTVYATLASGGRAVTPYAIKEVRNRDGQVLYRQPQVNAPVTANPEAVATLVDMMTSVVTSGTGRRATLDRAVAGKTGTTSDYRDAWFVGFTADYITGVWMGNDNNKPMQKITGGALPAQLWHDYMADAEVGLAPRPLLTGAPTGEGPSGEDSSSTTDDIGSFIQNLIGGSSEPEKPAKPHAPEMGRGTGVLGTLPVER